MGRTSRPHVEPNRPEPATRPADPNKPTPPPPHRVHPTRPCPRPPDLTGMDRPSTLHGGLASADTSGWQNRVQPVVLLLFASRPPGALQLLNTCTPDAR